MRDIAATASQLDPSPPCNDAHAIRLEPFKVAVRVAICVSFACRGHVHRADGPVDAIVATRRAIPRGDGTLIAPATPSLRCTPCAPASSRPASRPRTARDQVTGFQMGGELLAWTHRHDRHTSTDPRSRMPMSASSLPPVEDLARELSTCSASSTHHEPQIVREPWRHAALGSMRAEERLAAFLLNLTQRLRARGFSGSSLICA